MANQVARRLRKRQTIAETRLWGEQRNIRHQGYHSRRQSPVAAQIVDPAFRSQKGIVEGVGVYPDEPKARAADAGRDADLVWRSFKVLRFRNGDLAETLEGVMLEVLAALGAVEKPE